MYRKFHLIRQHDLMQCGAACLAMICHYIVDTILADLYAQQNSKGTVIMDSAFYKSINQKQIIVLHSNRIYLLLHPSVWHATFRTILYSRTLLCHLC